MMNSDPDGLIYLSSPDTNNGLFFLLTFKCCIFILNELREVSEYSKMRHNMIMWLKRNNDITLRLSHIIMLCLILASWLGR